MKVKVLGIIVLILAAISIIAYKKIEERHEESSIVVIHTVSFSNSAVFYLLEKGTSYLERKFVPNPSQHVEALLGTNKDKIAVSVTPFSNALIAISKHPELVIIGGSGMNGLSLVSSISNNINDLVGKTIGTARGDSLELFLYEAMEGEPYKPIYFTDPFVMVESAKRGDIKGVTHVEPFATDLVDSAGFYRVLTSKELWGNHPDAVLLTTRKNLEENTQLLRKFIRDLEKGEQFIEGNPEESARTLAGFYEMNPSQLMKIIDYQEPQIDIRNFEDFLQKRISTLIKLGYIDKNIAIEQVVDWRLFRDGEK